MNWVTLRTVLSLSVVTLAMVGCGGDSTQSVASTTSAPTIAEFAEEANVICRERDNRTRDLDRGYETLAEQINNAESPSASLLREFAEIVDKMAAEDQRAFDRVANLRRPTEMPVISKYLDGWRDRLGIVRQVAEAMRSGDVLAASALIERVNASRQRGAGQAEALGLTCTTTE